MNDDIVEDAELEEQYREEEAAYCLAIEQERDKQQRIPIGAYEFSSEQPDANILVNKDTGSKSPSVTPANTCKSSNHTATNSKLASTSIHDGLNTKSVTRKPSKHVSALLASRPYTASISLKEQKILSSAAIKCGGMSLILDGLPVLFPFPNLYTEQYRYMYALKQSLDAKGHALLEMPTGTGILPVRL